MSFKEAIKTVLKKKLQELDDEAPSFDDPRQEQRAEDLKTLLSHALIPLEYVAELAHVEVRNITVWTDYDLIPSVKLDGKIFITGENVVHMLEDENHSLHLNDSSVLPLTPDLAMKRLLRIQES